MTTTRRRDADALERVVSRDSSDVEKLMPAGVFGYSAGKSVIAKKLVKLFPEHKAYSEAFCGSAALFFTKEKAPVEVLNDTDDDVMFAYKAMQRASPKELEDLAAKNWIGSKAFFAKISSMEPATELDRLHKFLYLKHFTFGKRKDGLFRSDAEGRMCKTAARVSTFQPRLAGVKLLCGDYQKAIESVDGKDAFHFLDPPYAGSHAWGEIGEKGFDEVRLRKVLDGVRGRFLLTYGATGALDTSGFEVKRMQQPRQVGRGLGRDMKPLTHLLVSNFKLTSKSLGPDVQIDDVMQIVDVDDQGSRIMVTGSRTSFSVPEQIEARKWHHDNDLLAYPRETGPLEGGVVRMRFLEKRVDLDVLMPLNDTVLGWTLAVQKVDIEQSPELAAKGFGPEGSRYFRPLTKGVSATETPLEAVASTVVTVDQPFVEYGLQTETSHEYFLSKSGELAGQLTLERGADHLPPLLDKHPWLATFNDGKFIPNAVLKGAPMPPDGVSALPQALERAVPPEFRYWDQRGAEAVKCRDALVASGFFETTSMAVVDGQLSPVVVSHKLFEAPASVAPVADWPLRKAVSLLRQGWALVEAFSPGEIAKVSGQVVYVDAGDVLDGMLQPLTKALRAHAGDYIVTAVDSALARKALGEIGRPFQFRPGEGVSSDAVKRVFAASFGVRGEDILWLDKVDPPPPPTPPEPPTDPRKKPSVSDVPSDDTGDLGKVVKRTPRQLMIGLGPPNEWSGGVAAAMGPENRKIIRDAWDALSADEKKDVEAKFHANFNKAEFNNPDAGGAGEPARRREESKADFVTGEAGTLQPAVQWDVAGNPKVREKDRALKFVLKAETADEHYVFGIVLEPDVVDGQQDIYSADEVRASAHKYMAEFQNRGLMHKELVNGKVDILESYLAPTDFTVGSETVKKGTWCMAVRVKDAKLWEQCKSGGLTGFSIGGSANRQPDAKANRKYLARKESAEKKIAFQGIPIHIDRPKGFKQKGVSPDGKEWEREYKVDYGFIPRTKGGDGEGLDVFMGPNGNSPLAFWITQRNGDGDFDELKLVLGADDAAEAKKIYTDHVPEKFFAGMREGSVSQIKALLNQEPTEALTKAILALRAGALSD